MLPHLNLTLFSTSFLCSSLLFSIFFIFFYYLLSISRTAPCSSNFFTSSCITCLSHLYLSSGYFSLYSPLPLLILLSCILHISSSQFIFIFLSSLLTSFFLFSFSFLFTITFSISRIASCTSIFFASSSFPRLPHL